MNFILNSVEQNSANKTPKTKKLATTTHTPNLDNKRSCCDTSEEEKKESCETMEKNKFKQRIR